MSSEEESYNEEAPDKITYDDLEAAAKERFNAEQSVPEYVKNMQIDNQKYKAIDDEKSELHIPEPTIEIEKANRQAKGIIKTIDMNNSTKFNQYRNIINYILKFVRDFAVLYEQTTNEEYNDSERNEDLINKFATRATELDQQIIKLIPDVTSPISSAMTYMDIDNSFTQMNYIFDNLKKQLTYIYQKDISTIFKYITIGEGTKY